MMMLEYNHYFILIALLIAILTFRQKFSLLSVKTGLKGLFTLPRKSHSKERKGSRYGNKKDTTQQMKVDPLYITPYEVAKYDDRPWRPFRWPYHQTMSIFRLDMNHWLDMDKYYIHYIEEKERIWHQYGKENIDWLPESEDACLELMETVTSHMLERCPLLFTLLEDKKEKGRIVRNEILKETLDMTYPLKQHPLIFVSKMAKEDFYVVKKNPKDGHHYMVAAAVPFPGGSFGINHKIGKNLDAIHTDVPYYQENLKKSMERWFEKMEVDSPVERASWYISWDHKLKVNNVYQMPTFRPQMQEELLSTDPKEFNVRVERQTLRRLPKSKAIIFTNHPIFYSIEEMKDEPLVPSLIKKILYEGPEKIIKYKNFESFRDLISGYLDGLIQRQLDMGLIKEDTPLRTLPTYPFAHWVKTNFDNLMGWTNPSASYDKSFNYSDIAKKEIVADNE